MRGIIPTAALVFTLLAGSMLQEQLNLLISMIQQYARAVMPKYTINGTARCIQ
jgi:hypothetical protein